MATDEDLRPQSPSQPHVRERAPPQKVGVVRRHPIGHIEQLHGAPRHAFADKAYQSQRDETPTQKVPAIASLGATTRGPACRRRRRPAGRASVSARVLGPSDRNARRACQNGAQSSIDRCRLCRPRCPLAQPRRAWWPCWLLGLLEVPANGVGHSVIIVGGGNVVSDRAQLGDGVCHGDAHRGRPDHRDVVVVVADRQY